MKFAAHGPRGSVAVFLLALALMSALSFADSAAPPPSQVAVHLVSNGINETGIGQIVYHCPPNTVDMTEGKNISLNCLAGTCTNEPKYLASSCTYFPTGYFSYSYHGQEKSSENFNATKHYYRYYEYQLDVQTGKITPISASNGETPTRPICPALLVLVVIVGFVAGKQG